MFFCFGRARGDLLVRVMRARLDNDRADGERCQGKADRITLPVNALKSVGGAISLIKQAGGRLIEFPQCALDALLPIRALHEQYEVVATHMPDEIDHPR